MSKQSESWRASRDRARARAAVDPSLIPHGTQSGYDYWGCRCAKCTGASTGRKAASRSRAIKAAAAGLKQIRHGTLGGYGYSGCRCPECCEASAAYSAEARACRRRGAGGSR